ncbi:potassium channel family protein [Nitrospirota bacterium]
MKFLPSQLSYFIQHKDVKRNLRALLEFVAVLVFAIVTYSTIFHFIMEYEGKHYSWITGFYWTLTVMSTLGFGDITFTSDLGRVFSIVVLLSGIIFLLIMLPFTFIKFFYAPWLESQAQSRAPRELPSDTRKHVIITNLDPVAGSLIKKLDQYNFQYVIVVDDIQKASDLKDKGYSVVVGYLDKPDTYVSLRVENAALVFVNNNDIINTNIVATIREVSESVPIVTNVDNDNSMDILDLAGATHIFQFAKMLGIATAQHVLGATAQANILGGFGELLIAEAHAFHTPFEGKTLIESKLRESTGINVIGTWKRGKFEPPSPDTVIESSTILLLSGSAEHFRRYDEEIGGHRTFTAPVVILGGGRVGQAAAEVLSEHGVDFRVVEENPQRIRDDERYILGSAADVHVLERAGISQEAPTVLITTHDDDVNIYLTIYCRQLRPKIQIISRATLDRNISKLYNAGADIVLSFSSMGSNRIINILKPDEILMLAEGLSVFKSNVPSFLIGKSMSSNDIRDKTGCNVIAVQSGGRMNINPLPDVILNRDDELILIGTAETEKLFLESYS